MKLKTILGLLLAVCARDLTAQNGAGCDRECLRSKVTRSDELRADAGAASDPR
jgi:hypothetical protein